MLTHVAFRGTREEWDALCGEFSDFTVNQSYAWGEGRRPEGWSVARDVWKDAEGRVVAVATALRRRVRGIRIVYLSRGPVVVRSELPAAEIERRFKLCIEGYRRRLKWGEVLIGEIYQSGAEVSPPSLAEAGLVPLFPKPGARVFSSLVHLSDRDSLLSGASSNWRKLYRRSQDLLDEVVSSSDPQLLIRARELVARIEASKDFHTNLTPVLLREVAAGTARLFYMADEDGNMSAALLVAIRGRRASRLLAAVAPDEIRKHPGVGRVLEVSASRWAHDAGATVYDLEGLSPGGGGVSDFKLGMRGELFTPGGTHAASRPALLAAIYSIVKRRAWRTPLNTWRVSKIYFLQSMSRRLTRGRAAWQRIRIYARDMTVRRSPEVRRDVTTIILDRFDREHFRHTLSSVPELWRHCRDLEPGVKECCVVVGKSGFALGYCFVHWKEVRIPELEVAFPRSGGEAYIYNGLVIPESRGMKLYPYLLDQACLYARKQGAHTVVAVIHVGNIAPIRSVEKIDFRYRREAKLVKLGGWKRLRYEPIPPAGAADRPWAGPPDDGSRDS
jgi:ribosomal protein S18 acetylase RimI-like enzyme